MLSIALVCNNPWVYALAVFIVATLITELDFLENLAAIFWNRSWWRLRDATAAEVRSKIRSEAYQSEMASQAVAQSDSKATTVIVGDYGTGKSFYFVKKRILLFEDAIFERIGTLFEPRALIRRNVALQNVRGGPRYVLDGVVEQSGGIYVMDIKLIQHVTPQHVESIQRIVAAAREFWQEQRGESRDVFGILVVPATADVPKIFPATGVAILMFDEQSGKFTNGTEVRDWIRLEF